MSNQQDNFPVHVPTANPVFYRTYSRKIDGKRETWADMTDRAFGGLNELAKYTDQEASLVYDHMLSKRTMSSGRWQWVGGTDWIRKPENFYGAYNCMSALMDTPKMIPQLMNMAMQGTGTGAVVEQKFIDQFPSVKTRLNVSVTGEFGQSSSIENTVLITDAYHKPTPSSFLMKVGDSRQGWCDAVQALLNLAFSDSGSVDVTVDVSHVRSKGAKLKGFGGVANPNKLRDLFSRLARVTNTCLDRDGRLNAVEVCLLIDECALTIVAGNIRRCIPGTERVSSLSGISKIENISVGDFVLTSSGEYRKVINKFDQGTQDIVEIITPVTTLRCTGNHRVAVFDSFNSYKWKFARDLTPDDRMLSVPHTHGLENMTEDWAWLLGYFLGDGHADLESSKKRKGGGGQVTFAFHAYALDTVGAKLEQILSELGYKTTTKVKGNQAFVHVYRKELAEKLIQFKPSFTEPLIPSEIWVSSQGIRSAFLAGLADADGDLSVRNVVLNSSYIGFLREVQKLYLSLGIATKLSERPEKEVKGKTYRGCSYLTIRGIQSQKKAVDMINPYAVRIKILVLGQRKNGLSMPNAIVKEEICAGFKATTLRQTRSLIQNPKSNGYDRDANWDTLLAEGVCNPNWLPIEVIAVVPAGSERTWDIEVEGQHEFVCEGLLVHNSAGMRQGSFDDPIFAAAKDNLWQQSEDGQWRIDPDRDALRMANHTRVYHHKPSEQEVVDAVRKQFYSGEGAIQYAPEAIARANADIIKAWDKDEFIAAYEAGIGAEYIRDLVPDIDEQELQHRLSRYGLNPCGN